MGTMIISQPPAQYHDIKILDRANNSAYTGSDVTGAYVVMRSEVLNAAQATFDKIIVVAHLEFDISSGGGHTSQQFARVQIAGTGVGQEAKSPLGNNGVGDGHFGNCLVVTLVAGTDYTRGTGFTLDFAQKGVIGGGGGTGTTSLLGYTIEDVSD